MSRFASDRERDGTASSSAIDQRISRRRLIEYGALGGGAALLAGPAASFASTAAPPARPGRHAPCRVQHGRHRPARPEQLQRRADDSARVPALRPAVRGEAVQESRRDADAEPRRERGAEQELPELEDHAQEGRDVPRRVADDLRRRRLLLQVGAQQEERLRWPDRRVRVPRRGQRARGRSERRDRAVHAAVVYFLEGLCSAPSIVKDGTTDYTKPVGTGPFKFVSFAPNRQTVMVKNENYWVTGRPYLDGLTEILFDDATAQMNALLGGQVDVIGALDQTIAKTHAKDASIMITQAPSSAASYSICASTRIRSRTTASAWHSSSRSTASSSSRTSCSATARSATTCRARATPTTTRRCRSASTTPRRPSRCSRRPVTTASR